MSSKQALDLGGSRRRGSSTKVGSVWERRIMVDEVKVCTEISGTHDCAEENTKSTCNNSSSSSSTMNNAEIQVDKKVDNISPKPIKSCKSESSEGSPVQITRKRSELGKNLDEQCKKSPVQIKKTRDEIKLVRLRKVKSDSTKALLNDRKSELRRINSEPSKNLDQPSDGNLKKNSLSLQPVEAKTVVERESVDEHRNKSDGRKVVDELSKDLGEPAGGIEESSVGVTKSRSDEDCWEFGVCQEKAITDNADNESQIQIITTPANADCGGGEEEEEEVDKEIEVEVEKKSLDIKDINISVQEELVIEEKKLLPSNVRSVPISPPAVDRVRIHPSPTKSKPRPVSDHFHGTPSKLQSFADLIMWRDVSRSAFVFGIGAFAIISSSYTKDLNISFVSVLSYLGLVYLGVSFIFRSLISRGSIDNTDQEYVVGEEEAVWVIRLVLPCVNEFLLKLRSLFSGDPATTMKLAVILFILARCGGSITIWKMTRLGFFGVFMVPKLCSSYSSQLAAYGTFWIRRFGDAWESCSHKKAVGFGIFSLVWNLSSVVVRIWAVFILFVAFKFYQQQRWIKEQGLQAEESNISANSNPQFCAKQVRGRRSTTTEIKKPKKVC